MQAPITQREGTKAFQASCWITWTQPIKDTVRRYTFQRTFDKHFELMLEAFRNGEEPLIHARAGRRALALAQATIESFEAARDA